MNGRICQDVLLLAVRALKYRLGLAVNQIHHVMASFVKAVIFNSYHAMLVHVVQVCYYYNLCIVDTCVRTYIF